MQLTNMLSFLAIAMAINAAPAPNVEAAEGPYLKVRELVDSKSGVGDADYNYIKKSKVPELISRDANGVEESFLKGSLLPYQIHIIEIWADIEQ